MSASQPHSLLPAQDDAFQIELDVERNGTNSSKPTSCMECRGINACRSNVFVIPAHRLQATEWESFFAGQWIRRQLRISFMITFSAFALASSSIFFLMMTKPSPAYTSFAWLLVAMSIISFNLTILANYRANERRCVCPPDVVWKKCTLLSGLCVLWLFIVLFGSIPHGPFSPSS
ncbi:hypothetical protein AAMO2058_001287500 [Amorphochlora amoebiformis]